MSLKGILQGLGKLIGKKAKESTATGQSQKLLTYTPEAKKQSAVQLARAEVKPPAPINPRAQTGDLQMGERGQPLFGSSTYDWVMRKGGGRYSADEWVDHLTSTRKVNQRIFGKQVSRIERGPKQFTYDRGRYAGKQATINKEELFDSNVAVFDEGGNLAGGLLAAAKKYNLKLSAQDVGNFLKGNPATRIRTVNYGDMAVPSKNLDAFIQSTSGAIRQLERTMPAEGALGNLRMNIQSLSEGIKRGMKNDIVQSHKKFTNEFDALMRNPALTTEDKRILNRVRFEVDEMFAKSAGGKTGMRPTQYGNEGNYTFPGGTNYRETVFHLDEPIISNTRPNATMGHFSDVKNNLFHVRYDVRSTPNGKKAFVIHEIQSDANQNIAKKLTAKEAFGPDARYNPFQKQIENRLLLDQRSKILSKNLNQINSSDVTQLNYINKQLARLGSGSRRNTDYYPMLDSDAYGDYALKFLLNKAAKEKIDYVAVMPFNKLHFRQGYKQGNERFYGYADGKGLNKKGKSVMADLMKKTANFQDSKAGTIKIALSDPKKPYKMIDRDSFKYPDKGHPLSGKKITSPFHRSASEVQEAGARYVGPYDPDLYFNAYGIEVRPGMAYTQKLYKSEGGLVVDIFKPLC